ncbi:hypothetical protein WJX82_009916 [Trebouxia sp. C0006]
MCAKEPTLLGRKWTSDTNVEKLQFLTLLLGLTLDDIAARPSLLSYSVSAFLGPRVWFMYQTGHTRLQSVAQAPEKAQHAVWATKLSHE